MESNSSPFNVGIPINLPEFTPEQVADLAGRHRLNWGREEGEKLREMVGGHPYLVRLAFYHIAKGDLTLDRILEMAPTDEGIYRDHFGRHLDILEKDSELKLAFQKVVASLQPVPLEKKLALAIACHLSRGNPPVVAPNRDGVGTGALPLHNNITLTRYP